jgi:hypothetical protein
MTDDEPSPRRGSRPLTVDEVLVRDAHWPGFKWAKHGWPDPDVLRGLLAEWEAAGRPTHDAGSACGCPLHAAWPCRCPDTCPRCERRHGLQPFGAHRYDDSPPCPTPGACTCPELTGEQMDAMIAAENAARRAARPPVQGTLAL